MRKHPVRRHRPLAIAASLLVFILSVLGLIHARSRAPITADVPAITPAPAPHQQSPTKDTGDNSIDELDTDKKPSVPYEDWEYTGSAELSDVGLQALRRALPLLDAEFRLKPDYDAVTYMAWKFECFRHAPEMWDCVTVQLVSSTPLDIALSSCDDDIRPPILEEDEVAARDALLEETAVAQLDAHEL